MLVLVKGKPFITGLRTAFVEPHLWEELTVCAVCRHAEYLRDVGSVQGETLGTVASVCLDCEYGFLRRRPTKEWYDRFYLKEWDQEGQDLNVQGIRPEPSTYPFNFCAPHLQANSSVLDIGAGFGGLLLPFRDHGHKVFGIERSSHRARYLSSVLDIPSSNMPIESFEAPPGTFDLICMNHVLEHVFDPLDAIGKLARLLSDRGMLYIAVPDYWRGEYPPQAFHFVPHVSWFTFKSLSRLLTRSGFRILSKAEGKDIRILATKGKAVDNDTIEVSDTGSRSTFWDKTSTSMLEAFGYRNGRQALLWFLDNNQPQWYYQRHVLPGFRPISASLKLLGIIAHSPPRNVYDRLKGFLPAFLADEKLRVLAIELRGDRALPITVQYPRQQAPVWVK